MPDSCSTGLLPIGDAAGPHPPLVGVGSMCSRCATRASDRRPQWRIELEECFIYGAALQRRRARSTPTPKEQAARPGPVPGRRELRDLCRRLLEEHAAGSSPSTTASTSCRFTLRRLLHFSRCCAPIDCLSWKFAQLCALHLGPLETWGREFARSGRKAPALKPPSPCLGWLSKAVRGFKGITLGEGHPLGRLVSIICPGDAL